MNWEAIGAIGEMLSAMLVLITLIYVATQVRYAKNAAADANRLMRAKGVCDMNLHSSTVTGANLIAAKANGWDVWYHQLAEEFGLKDEDAAKADSLNNYWFWLHWGQFSSTNNKKDLSELGQAIGRFYQSPFIRFAWENSPFAKPLFGEDFIKFVDMHIQKHATVK
jgi:hypothetical protein